MFVSDILGNKKTRNTARRDTTANPITIGITPLDPFLVFAPEFWASSLSVFFVSVLFELLFPFSSVPFFSGVYAFKAIRLSSSDTALVRPVC